MSATIDGKRYTFKDGETILDAARALHIDIPVLCHDSRLKPYGGCRLCLVEVEGHDRLVAACTTALAEQMVVRTHTAATESSRKTVLRLLAWNCSEPDAWDRAQKPFFKYLRQYGLESELGRMPDRALLDDSHPYIAVDMSQCILCLRCVRICREVQGQDVWSVLFRGHETQLRPAPGDNLAKSPCVSCGACSDTCPTGAISDRKAKGIAGDLTWTQTTCPYCGTGCQLNVGIQDGAIVQVRPVLDDPVSKGHLCVKGRYAFDFENSADRITEPMIRKNGEWQTVSWEDATRFVAEALQDALAHGGPDAVGILGSSRATNEENYLTQKFARVCLGTNNVDCCARVCHAPSAAALKQTLGAGAATNCYDDLERASTILVFGANATENHPVIGARIKQAARNGCRLIVVDPRRIELAAEASMHLQIRPGTNVLLLNAMANVIIEEGLTDASFIQNRLEGFEGFRSFLQAYTPEAVASACGADANEIRNAARLYATHGPAMIIHGLGVTEHTQGVDGVMGLINLALLTGNIGKPGSGVNPLRGQNNVQGAAHMGCEPGILTGSVPLEQGASLFERMWKHAVPKRLGMNLMQMMNGALEGKLKALWIIGYDIALTNPNMNETSKALQSVPCIIVQDMFMTETARKFGTVFLPVASTFEKDGTFMNAERRVQLVRHMIDAPGNARPDWQIISDVAAVMGFREAFSYESPSAIWEEIRKVWPDGAGIRYSRLQAGPLQWPCKDETDPGTAILHVEDFAGSPRATLHPISFRPTAEQTDADYPFRLITGRVLYQFNAGTMSLRTPNTILYPYDLLEISPEDAARLHLRSGSVVRVISRYGEAHLHARITDRVRAGELFASFHTTDSHTNTLTGPGRDPVTQTPEYKITAVRVEVL